MKSSQNTHSTFAKTAQLPRRDWFAVVNDGVLGVDAYCMQRRQKIQQQYVRELRSRVLYCDARCFA